MPPVVLETIKDLDVAIDCFVPRSTAILSTEIRAIHSNTLVAAANISLARSITFNHLARTQLVLQTLSENLQI